VTVLGPDISSYQSALDLSRLADASFVIAKTTEGTYYTDADYQAWRIQAAQLGKLFAWYHFLSGESAAAQAQHTAANVGDKSLPGMLDAEPAGSFSPTLDQILAYIDAAHAAGLNLRLLYLPRWYWQRIGSPDLTPVAARGVHLVSSSYPGKTGSPTALYPGDSAAGWQPYGGMTPLIYQFTNQASDGGQPLDYNAFRGTATQLVAALDSASTTASGGATVPNIPPSISQRWPDIAGDFPPNAPYTDDTALIWSDAGARAAALYAREARDAVNALAARIGQPPAIDVSALAAALAPHLAGGATPEQVAAAVVEHLAATLAKG
jgi:hypothetical protein